MAKLATLVAVAIALIIINSWKTEASFSILLNNLHSSLKESIAFLESLKDESFVEADLLSGLGRPSSCAELLLSGKTKSGVYTIYPRLWYNAPPFQVFCDMDTDQGGWTVFQRRGDFGEANDSFYRSWNEYKKGFGNLTGEFWLGNEHLHVLTNQDRVELRIYLEDFEGINRFALYKEFQIASEDDDYRARIGQYNGNAGDGISRWHNHTFVTHDRNDFNKCAKAYKGGWWYDACHKANLNGLYLKGNHASKSDGVNWFHFKGAHYSLEKSEMKVRPTNFLKCVFHPVSKITPL